MDLIIGDGHDLEDIGRQLLRAYGTAMYFEDMKWGPLKNHVSVNNAWNEYHDLRKALISEGIERVVQDGIAHTIKYT